MRVIYNYNYAHVNLLNNNSHLTDRYLRFKQEISYGIRAARARLAVS